MQYPFKDGRIITVREFAPGDFDNMVNMFQNLNKVALRFGLPPYDRPRLERRISGLGGGILLLGLDRDKVVAASMVYGRPRSRLRGVGELVIYVHQEYSYPQLAFTPEKAIRGRQMNRSPVPLKCRGHVSMSLQVDTTRFVSRCDDQ